MKKVFAILFIVAAKMGVAQITNPAPCCSSTYGINGSLPAITKIQLSSLLNSSTHCAAPGYIYYNNISAPLLIVGSQDTIRVTFNNADLETALSGWIDFNGNSIFEPSEKIIQVNQGAVGFGNNLVKQAIFTVPGLGPTGAYRMRISIGWHFADNNQSIYKLDSCHTAAPNEYSAGETEDYDVYVTYPPGIAEAKENSFAFSPNPAANSLSIKAAWAGDITIFDLWGRKAMSFSLAPGTTEKDISGLDAGCYYILLSNEKSGSVYRKFIKL